MNAKRCVVLGGGAWGTALAHALAQRTGAMPLAVTLWMRNTRLYDTVSATRINTAYLPSITLSPQLACANHEIGLHPEWLDADVLILATSFAGLRDTAQQLAQLASLHQRQLPPVITLSKGVEAGTGCFAYDVLRQELEGVAGLIGILTGPSCAQEVAQGLPTALTLVSPPHPQLAGLHQLLHGGNLRVYVSHDVVGAEIGGAAKNVMAIAAGIADGLELGLNARAALMTRGLHEMTRLAVKLGGHVETLMGLTGMGDLILTCTGNLSRNRKVGLQLAQNQPLSHILAQLGHVAEGVYCAEALMQLGRAHQVDLPIIQAVCAVLSGDVQPKQALMHLLAREPKTESGRVV
jgi:glycerol-3-phosphate dehydrogenase (NAD(P)+)